MELATPWGQRVSRDIDPRWSMGTLPRLPRSLVRVIWCSAAPRVREFETQDCFLLLAYRCLDLSSSKNYLTQYPFSNLFGVHAQVSYDTVAKDPKQRTNYNLLGNFSGILLWVF